MFISFLVLANVPTSLLLVIYVDVENKRMCECHIV